MRWFEIALVVLTLFTGLVWLLDKLVFAKRREARQGLLDDGKEPIVVDYSKAFFPVLAVVLILRSFVAEPFRIPSNSMMPTLLTGDFIWSTSSLTACACRSTTTRSFPSANPSVATWWCSARRTIPTRTGSSAWSASRATRSATTTTRSA